MTLLKKADLNDANSPSSKAISNLKKDKDDTEELIKVIQDFIDTSKENLAGDSFDAIRNHLQGYINVLQSRMKIADSLLTAIAAANNKMIDYMEDQDKLDTAELESYKRRLTTAETQRDHYSSKVNNYDPDVEKVSLTIYQNHLASAEGEVEKYKKIVNKIENLEATDSSTYSTLMGAEQETTTFKTSVGEINSIRV